MQYTCHYDSPLGQMLLAADQEGLTGAWFLGQKYFARGLGSDAVEQETPILTRATQWLDAYFGGQDPDFTPPLHLVGTDFQKAVWEALLHIPYGQTTTYGALAGRLGTGAAQAVGGAVGRNPIAIIVPCHRVVGADGNLTGYAGGLAKKVFLLQLEAENEE